MYSISSSGQLTALLPSTVVTFQYPFNISTITIGKKSYAYVSTQYGNNDTIYMYSISSSSGQLTALPEPTISNIIKPAVVSIIGI
jgi:hypothetical protein